MKAKLEKLSRIRYFRSQRVTEAASPWECAPAYDNLYTPKLIRFRDFWHVQESSQFRSFSRNLCDQKVGILSQSLALIYQKSFFQHRICRFGFKNSCPNNGSRGKWFPKTAVQWRRKLLYNLYHPKNHTLRKILKKRDHPCALEFGGWYCRRHITTFWISIYSLWTLITIFEKQLTLWGTAQRIWRGHARFFVVLILNRSKNVMK